MKKNNKTKSNILIVEDEVMMVKLLKDILIKLGYSVCNNFTSAEEAIKYIESHKPDLVLMDIRLHGEMDGIDAAAQIYSKQKIPVVFLTAYADDALMERVKLTGSFGFILKPFRENELRITIDMALHKAKQEQKLAESENDLRSLFNTMTDIVFEMDYNGRYISIAPTSPELMFKPTEEVIGKTLHEVFPKPEADRFLKFVQKCLDKSKRITIEYPLTINDKIIWFEGSATPKSINTVLFIASDITKRKQTEEELHKHRNHLEKLVKERTEELEEKNVELKRYNKLFEGRELRIKELRDKVKELEGKLGRSI